MTEAISEGEIIEGDPSLISNGFITFRDFDPGDSATLPYLEFQTPELPALGVERVSKSKAALLSTGEQPVALIKRLEGFALQCTGCGAMSEPTQFRWKALDATVECNCLW